ncbi:hypothetical protein DM02DRAFT_682052 [Periconia macrospinosa]|uniref:Rhodopsin domain-containing protein n=1 Tax=Periconia macrospinosa TaxID=97972 RepID=A0A2V1DK24_9PLEO|nr:hypothetical protein DM02DRAFT_682052 [Periconia macrospinosa]
MATGNHTTVILPTGPLPPDYVAADRGHILISICICFIVLEVIAFVLRTFARRLRKLPFRWDEALVVFSLLSNLTLAGMAIASVTTAGVGKHTIVAARQGYSLQWGALNGSILIPNIYALAVVSSKLAILQLFGNIFSMGIERRITQFLAVIILVHGIVAFFMTLFQCNPPSDAWKTEIRENCLNMTLYYKYNCLPTVITDAIMLVLPIPKVWSLHAPIRMKLGVGFMLFTATIGVVSSIMRTWGFFNNNQIYVDPRWETLDLFAYTVAEPATYFLAICLSSYKVFGRYMKSERMMSFLSKYGVPFSARSYRGFGQFDNDDSKAKGGSNDKQKGVRDFDSVLLSEIERDSRKDNSVTDSIP